MDHAPALPPPTKRMRFEQPLWNSNLETLDDREEVGLERMRMDTSRSQHRTQCQEDDDDDDDDDDEGVDHESLGQSKNKDMKNHHHYHYQHQNDSSLMESDNWMGVDEESSKTMSLTPIAERGALIRYEGSKTMTLTDGVDGLLRHRWRDYLRQIPKLINTQGNELVLYRPPPPNFLTSQDDEDAYDDEVRIEELDEELDDDDTLLDSHDGRIHELEEKIMNMDLD
ncbi:hypothetical protein BGZ65_005023 [Modicella reniformis]|uniref:Uncharacterized protein n=1 Tax=Modicella reniformis TaxID=1440133 RepID=A0A9P6MH00_9FUNG|nr:hypothetical protein BGZ65_005023 [Modicella reniformis]